MIANRPHQLRCVRSKVTLSAEVVSPENRRPEFTGLVNLSGSGCLIESDREMQVGEVVFMRFSLPGQAQVETTARVARIEDDKIGVAFSEMSESASERIVRHVLQEERRRR